MFESLRSRIILIVGLLALCGWALIPKEGPTGERISPLNLGLDLQGGMHLAVAVDDPEGTLTSEARADAIDRTLTVIRTRIVMRSRSPARRSQLWRSPWASA